jgi:YHS domain-containing protein
MVNMATDPVCGMFVEEKPDSIQYTKQMEGNTTFAALNA